MRFSFDPGGVIARAKAQSLAQALEQAKRDNRPNAVAAITAIQAQALSPIGAPPSILVQPPAAATPTPSSRPEVIADLEAKFWVGKTTNGNWTLLRRDGQSLDNETLGQIRFGLIKFDGEGRVTVQKGFDSPPVLEHYPLTKAPVTSVPVPFGAAASGLGTTPESTTTTTWLLLGGGVLLVIGLLVVLLKA